MRRIARYFLWAFVFTVPWDMVTIAGVGTLSRLAGLSASCVAILATLANGRMKRPGKVFWLSAIFVSWAGATLLWTISFESTYVRVVTYVQLLASVWMIQEFIRTSEDRSSVYLAYCLGAFVPMIELLRDFVRAGGAGERYTAGGLNANDLALTLVVGLPLAWYLVRTTTGTSRIAGALYFAIAPVVVMLTGARGAFLAGLVALTIVPLTVRFRTLRAQFQLAFAVAAVVVGTWFWVPQNLWDRIGTIGHELSKGGTLTGRTMIWRAGLEVLPERPILGVGVAAYGTAVAPRLGSRETPHNLFLGVVVEQGMIGLGLFLSVLGACFLTIRRFATLDKRLWLVIGFSWFVGVLPTSWEYRKVTWLLIGLVAAQEVVSARQQASLRRVPRSSGVRRNPPPEPDYVPAHAHPVRGAR